ncbi:hypothetical protein [Amycolatopsis australiensis]|uniref:Uncharacterized protein n=1 Tax=Amycolatopsis australiensis TaxID=546364 RepID=A0A1K1S3J7_9PSEU|nr:hypothetical protein [Amycolatopsis australiensis]SFW78955.1 hypothetical protein SAMN04489730_4627 [Amycolatopsis australiensis]
MDISLFSHPVVEEPRAGGLSKPQDDRYGSLFLQPAYRPVADEDDTESAPRRQPGAGTHARSGRHARR